MKNKPIRKWDAVIILAIILTAAVLLLVPKGKADTAEIITDGKIVQTVDLSKVTAGYDITLDNGIVIRVEKNSMGFVSSPCENKLCIYTGMLTKAGQTAVCLPEKTLIRIKGKPAADAMTG